jgi:hypothetical protein
MGEKPTAATGTSRDEVAALARRAGLELSQEQFEELYHAWRHMARMIALIPRERERSEEIASAFVPPRAGSRG